MQITFLIGNGFDLGLGLRTRYEDFYEEYCKTNISDNENIYRFKSMLSEWQNSNGKKNKKIINWSDFEKAFGEHAKDFNTINKNEYIERFEHFLNAFNLYLELEEKKVDYSDEKHIIETMKNAVTQYYHIRTADKLEIEKLYNHFSSQRIYKRNYNFISFNYTKTLDNCANLFKQSIKGDSSRDVGKILHIHGFVEDNMIMGLDNDSQILNPDFAQDEEIVNEIVKPKQNDESRTNYESEVIPVINNSDIICVYGMSIGDTDKKWWSMISKWLFDSEKHLLVILEHNKEYNSRFPYTQRKVVNSTLERFLSFTDLADEEKQIIKSRIFVGVNYDVFSMKLRKEEITEEIEKILASV